MVKYVIVRLPVAGSRTRLPSHDRDTNCVSDSCPVTVEHTAQAYCHPSENPAMEITEIETVKRRLGELRVEHRDLDEVIIRLSEDPSVDELQLKRLKKRKLMLKDMIARLESKLIPDLNA